MTTKEKIENTNIDITKPFALVFSGCIISYGTDKLVDRKNRILRQTFDSKEEADSSARWRNKMLTPFDKKTCGMKYFVLKMNIKNYS